MARPSKNSLPQNENAPPTPSTSAPPPRPSLVRARSSSAPPPRRVFGEATNQKNPEDPDKRRSKRIRSTLAAQDHPPPPPPPRPPIRLDEKKIAARLATFHPIAAATADTPLALRLAPPAPSLTFSEPDPRQPGRGRAVSLSQSSPALLQPLPSANNTPPPPPLRTFPCEGYAVFVPPGQSAMATMPLDVLMGKVKNLHIELAEEKVVFRDARCEVWATRPEGHALAHRCGPCSFLVHQSLLVTWRATFDGRIDPDRKTLRKGEWTVRRLLEAYEAAANKRDEYWLQLDHHKRRIHSLSTQLQQSRLGTRQLIDAVSTARSIRISATFKENGRKSISQLVRSVRRLNKPSYRPKQYPKLLLDAGVLLWRAGSAELAQSFFLLFGFPSISTLRRNFHFFTFFACPGFPQLWEVLHHLDNHFRNISTENPALLALSLPWIVMNDAIHLTDRYEQCRRTGRWMGGAFWEMEGLDLTVSEASMATAGGRIEEGKLHRAKQASVYAVAPVGASQSYYGRVFLVLPVTDEKPDVGVDVQVNLFLSQILQWYFRRQNLGTVSCFNRDGDAYGRRGNYEAFSTSTLEKEASPAVFNLLAPLHLYDFSCGPGGVKYAADGKHNSKRVVTLTGRPNGINFDGISLSHKELRGFVREILPAEDERVIDDIVDHIDKMRVSGATRFNHLLSVISSDTPPPSSTFSLDYSNPLVQAKSRLTKLVGFIFGNYSNAQGDPHMDIRQRFVLLSSTAHSLYAAFLAYGTAFCQSELAHDIMSSILVMFYHAAILKSLGKEEQCMYLLQEGTDRLEEIFGILRTLFGTDKNMTLSMLSERISSLSEILRIRESLKIRPKNKRRDISLEAGYDHEAPRDIKGECRVATFDLEEVWREGREMCEEKFRKLGFGHHIPPEFDPSFNLSSLPRPSFASKRKDEPVRAPSLLAPRGSVLHCATWEDLAASFSPPSPSTLDTTLSHVRSSHDLTLSNLAAHYTLEPTVPLVTTTPEGEELSSSVVLGPMAARLAGELNSDKPVYTENRLGRVRSELRAGGIKTALEELRGEEGQHVSTFDLAGTLVYHKPTSTVHLAVISISDFSTPVPPQKKPVQTHTLLRNKLASGSTTARGSVLSLSTSAKYISTISPTADDPHPDLQQHYFGGHAVEHFGRQVPLLKIDGRLLWPFETLLHTLGDDSLPSLTSDDPNAAVFHSTLLDSLLVGLQETFCELKCDAKLLPEVSTLSSTFPYRNENGIQRWSVKLSVLKECIME